MLDQPHTQMSFYMPVFLFVIQQKYKKNTTSSTNEAIVQCVGALQVAECIFVQSRTMKSFVNGKSASTS